MRLQSATVIISLIFALSACLPNVPSTPDQKPTSDNAVSLSVTGNGDGLPAGASQSFALVLNYASGKAPQAVDWKTENVPTGVTAAITSHAAPWSTRLVVTTDGTLAAGSYTLDVVATTDTPQTLSATVKLNVTACIETASGSSTQAVMSHLVELITAGKPAIEHGLLVPIQICGKPKHLQVKLTQAIATDNSVMTTPPPFYLFRSEVWPAPDHINAHGLAEGFNVQVPNIPQTDGAWQLDADVTAGLYLLIFERDRYAATLTPQNTPATVTYDVIIN